MINRVLIPFIIVLISASLKIHLHHLFFIWFKRALLLAKVLFELIFRQRLKCILIWELESLDEKNRKHWTGFIGPYPSFETFTIIIDLKQHGMDKCNFISEMSGKVLTNTLPHIKLEIWDTGSFYSLCYYLLPSVPLLMLFAVVGFGPRRVSSRRSKKGRFRTDFVLALIFSPGIRRFSV